MGTNQDSFILERSPLTFCFGYGTGSVGKSPQWDTDPKRKLVEVITLPYLVASILELAFLNS